jgi:hypothetical protein
MDRGRILVVIKKLNILEIGKRDKEQDLEKSNLGQGLLMKAIFLMVLNMVRV